MVVTEIFDDDQEQAAHLKSLTEKPARPRRTRKKAEPAVAEDALNAPSDSGTLKPARRSRKRNSPVSQETAPAETDATSETPPLTPPVVDDLDSAPDAAPAPRPRKTPARRPRARKAAAAHAEAPLEVPADSATPQPEDIREETVSSDAAPETDRPPVLDSLIAPVDVTGATPQPDEASSDESTPPPSKPVRASKSRSRRTPQPALKEEAALTTAPPDADDTDASLAEATVRPPVIEELITPVMPVTPDVPAAEPEDLPAEEPRSGTDEPPVTDPAPADDAEPASEAEQDDEAGPRRKRTHRGGRNRRRDTPQAALPPSDERLALPASDEPLALPPTADLLLEPLQADRLDTPASTPADAASAETAAITQPASKPRSRSARRRAAAARRKAEAAARAQEAAMAGTDTASTTAETTEALLPDNAEADPAEQENALKAIKPAAERKMLVSVLPGELVEVVILEDNLVAEYYVEMVHQAKIRGNIYKGVVSNIDPNLQAAFVNFGGTKNGFLQIDEIHPEYWLTHHDPEKGGKYPPIQKVMKAGQEVLVQVVKEPNGSKGAFLTTWVSLAGRFLVLTPGQEQIGISRKVEDGEERNRLRELIKGLNPGEGLGAIVRTVSAGTSKTTLQKDLSYLKRVWKDIHKRAGTEKAPCLIYEEPGLASRAVRDYLSDDVTEVWVDDPATAESMRAMTTLLFPRRGDFVRLYDNPAKSMWEFFNVRKQLEQVHAREVTLPSGGRLVFDQTEALMAIDINSGKSGGKNNFEATALRTNLEAAESIARQLRLRDVGGQVVIDFIEMRDQSRCREVERTLHAAMKSDRARHDIGHMSSFGLLQIVRQRIGSSAISISQEPCPHCRGTGLRRNMEWQALQLLRELRSQMRLAARNGQSEYVCPLGAELAVYVLNHKRERLVALEKEFHLRLEIRIAPGEV